ncbi:MAG: hypothetical protein AB7R00_11175 [Kofleriaceae bacterium]
MTRTYDTGLTIASRTLVRNAIATLLAPLLKSNGGFLRSIVKLPAPLETYEGEGDVQQIYQSLLGQSPAIAVALGDRPFSPAGVGGFRYTTDLEVHVYFIGNSNRSLLARVEGDVVSSTDDTADPGVDVAMQCAAQLLIGQKIETLADNASVKHLVPQREQALVTNNQHTIWKQLYTVGVTETINQDRGIIAKLLGIDTTLHPSSEPVESPARIDFSTEVGTP